MSSKNNTFEKNMILQFVRFKGLPNLISYSVAEYFLEPTIL